MIPSARRATAAAVLAVLAVLAVALLAACGTSAAPATPSPTVAAVASTATPTATAVPTPTATPAPRRPVVVLDPGHGGDEVGAAANGLVERDSNLDMALRTEAYLEAAGVDVVLTRRDEGRATGADTAGSGYSATRADLLARVRIANAAHADVFVSIHSNGSPNPDQRGIEVWYDSRRTFGAENETLAQTLLDSTLQALTDFGGAPADRGIKDAACWQEYRGRCVGLYVLSPAGTTGAVGADSRPGALATEPPTPEPNASPSATPRARIPKEATEMPGALVELLFLTNTDDAALLSSDGARDALAHGLANGILEYLAEHRG